MDALVSSDYIYHDEDLDQEGRDRMMYGSYTDNTQSTVGLGHYLAFGSGGYPSGRLVVDHEDEGQATT